MVNFEHLTIDNRKCDELNKNKIEKKNRKWSVCVCLNVERNKYKYKYQFQIIYYDP